MIVWVTPAPPSSPGWAGDPEAPLVLEEALRAALEATEAFGSWPSRAWTVRVHPDPAAFERATGAPPPRTGAWLGDVLHLRPLEQLQRRDLGRVLRHELTHRRLGTSNLRRWEEEARCLWAETHVQPPPRWPEPPSQGLQDRLDRALARGTTAEQAWAYRLLRAWAERDPLPEPPRQQRRPDPEAGWEPVRLVAQQAGTVTVRWPAERMPARVVVNGRDLLRGTHRFEGTVRFGPEVPVQELQGQVELRHAASGWELLWTTDASTWVAAATAGEMGEEAPLEARRALAAVLKAWLQGHPAGNHADGSLCPLTHCAVVRGMPSRATIGAATSAPADRVPKDRAFFTGSAGGMSLSPREVWGRGASQAGSAVVVPGDRWGSWERIFTPDQVATLKRNVRPGVHPGQRGLRIGASGPYPVEDLRLAAGRAFGWTSWPGNVCEAALLPDGSMRVQGRGWGHHVGLCMATAMHRALQGASAEVILAEAFPD